jgi:hypothetical protein
MELIKREEQLLLANIFIELITKIKVDHPLE